jgi:hypothetical protein
VAVSFVTVPNVFLYVFSHGGPTARLSEVSVGIDERKKEEALRPAVNMTGPDLVTEPRAESVTDASRRL